MMEFRRPRRADSDPDGWVHGLIGLSRQLARLRNIVEDAASDREAAPATASRHKTQLVHALLGLVKLAHTTDRLVQIWAAASAPPAPSNIPSIDNPLR